MRLIHIDDAGMELGERFALALRSVVAVDCDRAIRMVVSHGRRRSGYPTRYYVLAPTGRTLYTGESIYERVFGLTAWGDDEAIAKANPRLEKWLAKGLIFDDQRNEWVTPTASESEASAI